MLLNHGVDLAAVNAGGTSAWHAAAQGPGTQVVEVLLKQGCDVSQVNNAGWGAAHFAARYGTCLCVLVVGGGGHVCSCIWCGFGLWCLLGFVYTLHHAHTHTHPCAFPPLFPLRSPGQTSTLTILLTAGIDPTTQCHAGRTPLHYAAQAGCAAAVQALLQAPAARAMLDCTDEGGWTALHHATHSGCLDTMQHLLKASASCNIQSKEGHTPLHLAVSVGVQQVQVLLDAGVDQGLTDAEGCTAAHYAVQHGDHDVFVLLCGGEAGKGVEEGGVDSRGMVGGG